MSTKMKGLLKGLRYISQIFDEEKEPEMQIGFPTDVKHVAHIGWDGPSVDSPSWMKEFKAPGAFQSAPLAGPGQPHQEGPEIKWVSEDSKSSSRSASSSARDNPEAPRSSRRRSSDNFDSPKKESSTKRGSRRHLKDSSDSVRSSNRQTQDQGLGSETGSLPDIPKKSRRKKSKEAVNGGSTRASRSKGTTSNTYTSQFSDEASNGGSTRASRSKGINSNTCTSQFSDSGPETGSVGTSGKVELSQLSSMKLSNITEEEKGNSGVS